MILAGNGRIIAFTPFSGREQRGLHSRLAGGSDDDGSESIRLVASEGTADRATIFAGVSAQSI